MERRPYLAMDVSRLIKLVNRNERDTELLGSILYELQYRKTNAARQLERRVEQLLSKEQIPAPSDVSESVPLTAANAGNEERIEMPGGSTKDIEVSPTMREQEEQETIETFLQSVDPFVLESLEVMRKKLLDLTARNRLLNFPIKQKGTALRVVGGTPNGFCQKLLSEREIRFVPVPLPARHELLEHGYLEVDEETGQDIQVKPRPSAKEWAAVIGIDVSYELPRENGMDDSVGSGDVLQVLLYPSELETRLRTIRRKAQTALEEMGATILYFSFGFLEWREQEDSDKARLAPLFSVPVQLTRGKLDQSSGTYQYALKFTGEDILPNLSLREKLHLDFGLALPEVDEDVAPEDYLDEVSELVRKNRPSWRVLRYGALTVLNFGKMLMYLDLDPARWPLDDRNLVQHPIVQRFFTSEENPEQGTSGADREHQIDIIEDIHDRFPLIDDADSSQHSALIDAINGHNLVIEGPPGTGKSQTITNLIAAAMLGGKKVLFVAEKMAALDVVKDRLDRAGLGDFCLELHSHKSQKRRVLEDIKSRVVNEKHFQSAQSIDSEITRLEEVKSRLNQYAEEINETWGSTGLTVHEILSGASRYRLQLTISPVDVHVSGLVGSQLTEVDRLRLADQVREFQDVFHAMQEQLGEESALHEHPWSGVENIDIQVFDSDQIVTALEAWQESLEKLLACNQSMTEIFGCDPECLEGWDECGALASDLAHLPALSPKALPAVLRELDEQTLMDVEELLDSHDRIQDKYRRLSDVLKPEKLLRFPESDELPPNKDLQAMTGSAQSVPFNDIVQATMQLKKAESGLQAIYEQLEEVKAALPSRLGDLIEPTFDGFGAAKTMIEVIGSLESELIALRSEHFDDDDLDQTLEELESQIIHLRPLRQKLSQYFDIESLPDSRQLQLLQRQLARKGVSKLFSGQWWGARKRLKEFAVDPDVKVARMSPLLGEAVEFKSGTESLDETELKRKIGPAYQGLDTHIEALLPLRAWYKQVRATYGIGFGKSAAIGDEIISLDARLLKGARQLHANGLAEELDDLLSGLRNINTVIPNFELGNTPNQLIGEQGSLLLEYKRLGSALKVVQSWFKQSDLTLGEVKEYLDDLGRLEVEQKAFNGNDLLVRLFADAGELSVGLNAKNEERLQAIKETLAFAYQLRDGLDSEPLVARLRAISTHEEYEQIKRDTLEYPPIWQAQSDAFSVFTARTQLNISQWLNQQNWQLRELLTRNQMAIQKPEWLNDWINFVRIRNNMRNQGLEPIWNQVTEGELEIADAADALDLAVFDQLSREILAQKPHLARFSGKNHSALQKTFRDYDQKLKSLQRQRIASLLVEHHVPPGSSGGRKSEYTDMALIKNELGKKTRHIPIRQLINRAGRALSALKPCFMMGPLSAAHYLQPGKLEFDLVVMDEASQVKPEDALGIIARGKQLVVVGDPKQLPPTSFFDRQDMLEDDEESAALAENDSILDAALPMFSMRRLRWHYRSQHESLIAFSNRNFYDNDLVIFPSPNASAQEYGVKFTYVKGSRFSDQRNVEEANVVAKAAVQHARSHPNESLGIVAMSAKQRDQIERAVEELCKADSTAADAVDKLRNLTHGMFIKNLENVQGDERDVIFVSCTYGPSEVGGRVYQRFGPINSDVGWRRLNVLFTRSKKRMHIFSSMRSHDILISETSKRGVVALRNFLDYAEKGSMDGTPLHTGKAPDSDFEIAVIEALYQAGFESEAQVGVAGFFIDLAVKDPGNPGRYLMGIECDGATYHSAQSARDRDRLRQEVLERLGWRIRRIWSTDWFSNPVGELEPIIRELHRLKSTPAMSEEQLPMDLESVVEVETETKEKVQGASQNLDSTSGLRDRLESFRSVISAEFPDTPTEKQLLRPAMIEALLEYEPVTASEFVEWVPDYLRHSTEQKEAKHFLGKVLEIIAD